MTNTVTIADPAKFLNTDAGGRDRSGSTWVLVLLAVACLSLQGCSRVCGSKASEMDNLAPLLELRPGSTIAEIGAGSGAVAVAAAQRVGPSGHVYATEIDRSRLSQIRAAAEAAGLSNLTVVESTASDTRLPAGCCEGIYMIGVYHHFTEPFASDASIFRALRNGGRLVVVDFRPSLLLKPWTPEGVPANRGGHGIPPSILEDELTRSGFQISRAIEPWGSSWLLSNYCLVFTKPSKGG